MTRILAHKGCPNVNLHAPYVTKREARGLPFAPRSCGDRLDVEFGSLAPAAADDFDGNVSQAVHAERARARRGQVDDAPGDERPAIIDAHDDRTPGLVIGDPHAGPKRKG